jgi:hypothetical protein
MQTCTEPAAQVVSQLEVVPLLPPFAPTPPPRLPAAGGAPASAAAAAGGGFAARQHTCEPSQLAALEQAVIVCVPVGQSDASATQVAPLAALLPAGVQQVRLGASQNLPAAPQGTEPSEAGLMGALLALLLSAGGFAAPPAAAPPLRAGVAAIPVGVALPSFAEFPVPAPLAGAGAG